MSGLFTAAFLRQIGWDVDVYERSRVELVGRGAGITGHPELLDALTASGAGTERARRRGAQARRARPRRPHHRRTSAAADPHLLGPAATPAARHHRSGALPSRPQFRARRAGRARRARTIRRRRRRAGRHSGRRRRHPLERARADGARAAADLCRLLHLARRAQRGRPRRRDAAHHLSAVHLLPAQASAGDRLSDRRLRRRSAARQAALQFHLVPRRRRRAIARHVRRRERRAARLFGAAAADPQGPDRRHAQGRARAVADRAARLPDEDQAALHHADLRLHRAADRVRARRHGRRRRRQCAPAYGLRHGQGRDRRAGAGQASGCARRHRRGAEGLQRRAPADRQHHRAARPQARHAISASISRPKKTAACTTCLQSDGAMLDWIAVPNFLDAYK